MKQTGIRGIDLADLYHDWFKGDPTEGKEKGEASATEREMVLSGKSPLPSGARIFVSLDSIPKKLDADDVVKWPRWTCTLTPENGAPIVDVFEGFDPPEGSFMCVQGGGTPSSNYGRSFGYWFIFVGPVVSSRCSLKIEARVGDWTAESPLVFPWVARA